MFKRREEAEALRRLFAMKELKPLKKVLATEVARNRKRLENDALSADEVARAQARLKAYKDILDLGKTARRYFIKIGNTR